MKKSSMSLALGWLLGLPGPASTSYPTGCTCRPLAPSLPFTENRRSFMACPAGAAQGRGWGRGAGRPARMWLHAHSGEVGLCAGERLELRAGSPPGNNGQ